MSKVSILGMVAALALALGACSAPAAPQASSTSRTAPTGRPAGTPTDAAPSRSTTHSVGTASEQQIFDVSTPQGPGHLLAAKEVGLGADVPWGQVGHGWRLSLLQQGKQDAEVFQVSAQMLDLIAPSGGRYQLLKTLTKGTVPWSLDDWSSDGHTALLVRSDDGRWSTLVAVDLRTGSQLSLRVAYVFGALLRDDGSGLWVTDGMSRVRSIAWDGSVTTYRVGGTILRAPDGLAVGGGGAELTILNQSGRTTSVPTPMERCRPVRWWSPGVVLTQCVNNQGVRLVAIPLDGSRPTWVSKPHGKDSIDLGDYDAYLLDGTTYLQVAGACGYTFLGRQNADGSITDVNPPDAIGNVTMQGVLEHALLVTHEMSCEPPGPPVQVLAAYDPVARTEHVLAQLLAGERFGRMLPYDSPIAVGW
jgi:TolB protein